MFDIDHFLIKAKFFQYSLSNFCKKYVKSHSKIRIIFSKVYKENQNIDSYIHIVECSNNLANSVKVSDCISILLIHFIKKLFYFFLKIIPVIKTEFKPILLRILNELTPHLQTIFFFSFKPLMMVFLILDFNFNFNLFPI